MILPLRSRVIIHFKIETIPCIVDHFRRLFGDYVRACWMPRKSKTLSCSKQADSYLVLISLQILQHSGPKSGAIIASLRYASSEEGTEGETAIVAGRASDRDDRTRRTLAIFKSISIDRHSERL